MVSAAILLVGLAVIVMMIVNGPAPASSSPAATLNASSASSVAETVAASTTSTSTTMPLQPCDRRVVMAAAVVHSEPSIGSRIDGRLPAGRPLCVLLVSKDRRWVYVRYASPGANPGEVCAGQLSLCSVGWVRQRRLGARPS